MFYIFNIFMILAIQIKMLTKLKIQMEWILDISPMLFVAYFHFVKKNVNIDAPLFTEFTQLHDTCYF